jgi:hypothetical protein
MKILITIAVLLFSLNELNAQNFLKNGNFSNGNAHWEGDGLLSTALADSDSLNGPSGIAPGTFIPLKTHWTAITQEFKAYSSSININLVYKVSSNLDLSKNPDDYVAVHLHSLEDWGELGNGDVGKCVVFVRSVKKTSGCYFLPKKVDTNQTFTCSFNGFVPGNDYVFCIAFPPG